eukprot:GEMP01008345.1.p1 GENE.GEMP01008345.1~~GEMP01008345.1.p1  ORF type:complete len:754 (+),score=158.32 GEMP01008345.1:656-2917(+)
MYSDEESERYDNFDCSVLLAPRPLTLNNPLWNTNCDLEFVFVVDISGSMMRKDVEGSDDRRIDVVVRACVDFVKKQNVVSPNGRYSLIHFHDFAKVAFTNVSATKACKWFSQNMHVLASNFGTNYFAALGELKSLDLTSHIRVLFLSDGRPAEWNRATLGTFQWTWLPRLIAQSRSLEIHCIGFGPSASEFEVLQQISQLGRGTTQIANLDVTTLRRCFASICTRMTATQASTSNSSSNSTARSVSFGPPPRSGHDAKAIWLKCKRFQYSWDPTTANARIHNVIIVEVSRDAQPYAQGNMRFVYDMREEGKMDRMVAKETKLDRIIKDEEECFAKSSACAAYFATLFRERTGLEVRVLPCCVYRVEEKMYHRKDISCTFMPWFCAEKFIPGVFTKWISNSGYISDNPQTKVLASFAHFTHHHSSGQLMVTDLQGVYSDYRYTLTDPQVHSTDKRFGRADLGRKGMQMFLSAHKCGTLCRSLDIPPDNNGHPPPLSTAESLLFAHNTAVCDQMETHALFKPAMFFVGECSLSFSHAAAQLYTEKSPHTPIKDWYLTELHWPVHGGAEEARDRSITHFKRTYGDAVCLEPFDTIAISTYLHMADSSLDRCIWSMPYPDDFSPHRTPLHSPELKAEMCRRVYGFVKAAAPLLKPSVDACVSVVLADKQHVEWGLREPVRTEKCDVLFPEVHAFRLQELLDRGYVPRFGDTRDTQGQRDASCHHGSEAVVLSWRRLASPLSSSGRINDTELRQSNIF